MLWGLWAGIGGRRGLRLFTSDQQQSQVTSYPGVPINVTGQAVTIGEPGGHVPGPWNPQRMGRPFALTIEERDDGSQRLTASIPWSALAVQPRTGATLRGDLGVLFGDDTGANTAQRVHWVDRETNVVNDIPTEAEFFPERWGTWTWLRADAK